MSAISSLRKIEEPVFVDVQTRGPYALWHHTHEFESDESGTIIRDRCGTASRSARSGTGSAVGSSGVISMRC